MQENKKILTSILPVHGSFEQFKDNFYLREKFYREIYHEDVNYIIIHSGNNHKDNNTIKEICDKNGWKYIFLQTDTGFNLSRSRNLGILAAETEFIIFEDFDLIQDLYFYKNICTNILSKWENMPFNFISIPVAYLSEKFSSQIVSGEIDISTVTSTVKDSLLFNKNIDTYIENYVPQSSVLVLKKNLALFIGLFDENFSSWGGEDRDFVFRLLASNTRLDLPKDFSYTSTEYGYNISKYVGWKALWTLHGDYAYENGLISFHLYHDERSWRNKKLRGMKNPSLVYCEEKIKLIKNNYNIYIHPAAKNCNTFIYGRNPHLITYELFETLGGFNIIEENISYEKIISLINKDSTIIIWNPYNSKHRLSIYKQLKEDGYCVLIAERGALPDSIVFDSDGLVIFSKNYDKTQWDKPISDEERAKTVAYLNKLTESATTLENNGNRRNTDIIKHELGLHKYEHILLCCLQLQSDTVTNQVTPDYISYQTYIEEINQLATSLPDSCKLLIKNHPLTKIKVSIPGTICVDKYHIHDVIEISDAVIVYNSGTGIIARAFKKPVFCFGISSYNDPRFTYAVSSHKDVINNIHSLIKLDEESVIRYFSYLINHFYSFAKFYSHTTRETNDAILRYPSRIAYYHINISNRFIRKFNQLYFRPQDSYLFKRFYNYNNIVKKEASNKQSTQCTTQKKASIKRKKFNKLIRNPVQFLKDSKYNILRKIGFFFETKKSRV